MLRDIPSAALKELVKLSERKEALMARIQEIDREMLRVQNKFGIPSKDEQSAAVTVSGTSRQSGRQRAQRGALKEKIVATLRERGAKGATVGELSQKLRVPSANLYVRFNSTGKNVRGLKKIGAAKYRLI
jgi:G:T/U-mismatch repair DNA glycosylase